MVDKSKILFVYQGPHYFHRDLMDSIGADFYGMRRKTDSPLAWYLHSLKSTFSLPNGYDIYVSEGIMHILAFAKLIGKIPKHAILVNLCADHVAHATKQKKGLMPKLWAFQKMDGFICIGKMQENDVKNLLPEAKCLVIQTHVKPDLYSKLSEIKRERYGKHVIFLGVNNGLKNADLLIEVMNLVFKEIPDAKLTIIGQRWENLAKKNKDKRIVFVGFVDDVVQYISEADLSVHLAKYDAFPLGTLEPMVGGVPTIVSEFTGSKEIIVNLGDEFVCPLDKEEAARRIVWFLNLDHKKREEFSQKARKSVEHNQKDHIIPEFQKKFWGLINEIKKSK
jgi:glycosyltransferase involved in cell wall biosynthesis